MRISWERGRVRIDGNLLDLEKKVLETDNDFHATLRIVNLLLIGRAAPKVEVAPADMQKYMFDPGF